MSDLTIDEIKNKFKEIQDNICNFLIETTKTEYFEDNWDYEKGDGGGRSRIFGIVESEDANDDVLIEIEKGGVNYSGIYGENLPESATTALKINTLTEKNPDLSYHATGVSIVIHPLHPHIPTIHMNIRYFETLGGDLYWFGGGIDLTPCYPKLEQVIEFHQTLKNVCDKHDFDYEKYKVRCDEYFYLKHRNEERGIGGVFFDHLNPKSTQKTKNEIFDFICDIGMAFIDLYKPFLVNNNDIVYSEEERNFQLWRRSRYVEFNLLFDRGTKFGIQSGGRTESILMSMPATAIWKYNHHPKSLKEKQLIEFFLKPQSWLSNDIHNKYNDYLNNASNEQDNNNNN